MVLTTPCGAGLRPPGGNRFLHEVFYSDDIYFIFDRLLNVDSKTKEFRKRIEAGDSDQAKSGDK